MIPDRRLLIGAAWGALGTFAAALPALAAEPEAGAGRRRIELVVPFPPGGTADLFARVIGRGLAEKTSVPVVVVNRPGATGTIGAESVAAAAPDGATLLLTSYADRRVLFDDAAGRSTQGLVPLVLVAKAPLLLVAHPSAGKPTLEAFIAEARRAKGNYASIGNGTPSHLAMEKLKRAAGIELTQVPYKGSGQALTDVIAGHVPVMFDSVVSALPHVKAGKLRALAVSTSRRLPTLPDVPTVGEAGVADFDVSTWAVIYAPPGTPERLAEALRADIAAVLADPAVAESFAAQGALVPPPMSRADVAAFIRADVASWKKLIAEQRITAD